MISDSIVRIVGWVQFLSKMFVPVHEMFACKFSSVDNIKIRLHITLHLVCVGSWPVLENGITRATM